jgi:hypothetical protein
MAIAQEIGFAKPWLLFDTYLDEVAHACEQDVVPRWIDRLGGADVLTLDHCFKVAESLRIDSFPEVSETGCQTSRRMPIAGLCDRAHYSA